MGDVPYVGHPVKRKEMVLAHRVKGDVSDDDHLLVGFIEGHLEEFAGVLVHPRKDLGVHLCDTTRCLDQAGPFRVFSDSPEQLANSLLYGFLVYH